MEASKVEKIYDDCWFILEELAEAEVALEGKHSQLVNEVDDLKAVRMQQVLLLIYITKNHIKEAIDALYRLKNA